MIESDHEDDKDPTPKKQARSIRNGIRIKILESQITELNDFSQEEKVADVDASNSDDKSTSYKMSAMPNEDHFVNSPNENGTDYGDKFRFS